MRTRIIALGMGAALLAAACGGSSGTGTASTGTGASAAASEPASMDAGASGGSGSGAGAGSSAEASAAASEEAPSIAEASPSDDGPDLSPGAVADLEAMLPSEANGITFTKGSIAGDQLASAGVPIDDKTLAPILAANGKTISDVRLATATASDSSPSSVMVIAFQVKGMDATKLLPILGDGTKDLTPKEIGGKQALVGGGGAFLVVAYPHDDVLFYTLLGDEQTVTAIMQQLP